MSECEDCARRRPPYKCAWHSRNDEICPQCDGRGYVKTVSWEDPDKVVGSADCVNCLAWANMPGTTTGPG